MRAVDGDPWSTFGIPSLPFARRARHVAWPRGDIVPFLYRLVHRL